MRAVVRWMAAGLVLAACSSPGVERQASAEPERQPAPALERQLVGRWNAPRGYTEFGADGSYAMAVSGGARVTGRYAVLGDGRVAVTYHQLPGRGADTLLLTVRGDTLRVCEPRHPGLPCPALLRAEP